MRPERDTIASPDLPEGMDWVGEEPESMPALTAAGPALGHFLDFPQLSSVRTLPYVSEWARPYEELGLATIGVQAPRFPFGADRDAVAAGVARVRGGGPGARGARPPRCRRRQSSSPAAPGSTPGPPTRTATCWRSSTRPAAPTSRSRATARSRSPSTASHRNRLR